MIELKNINKTFTDTQVLFDINHQFEKGKINLIIGQSGSGKSVLTKCIVGLYEPDPGGAVLYDGRDFTVMSKGKRKEIQQEIGMLFQHSALFDSMTVEQNVGFPLTVFTKMTPAEIEERVNFCLKRVELENKNHLFPAEISGGMQKRVAIARAIAMKPKYLFCDEPNSGLDPKTSIVIDNLIKDITYEYNMTTVVITHDMNSVIEIGDTIMFIYEGRKEWEGHHKRDIITTDNEKVVEFVYASEFMKTLRDKLAN